MKKEVRKKQNFTETWTVDEVSSELKMDKRNVKKRLEWWQNSGVVYVSSVNKAYELEMFDIALNELKLSSRLSIKFLSIA